MAADDAVGRCIPEHHGEDETPFPHWRVWRAAAALDDDADCSATGGGGGKDVPYKDSRRSSLLVDEASRQRYGPLAREAAAVLRGLGRRYAGRNEFQSFLNKPSLLHEVEESIVAIEALVSWLERRAVAADGAVGDASSSSSDGFGVTVVDVCCGKGIFSTLLSYLASRPSPACRPLRHVRRGVMADKLTDDKCNWHHINAVNADCCNYRTANESDGAVIDAAAGSAAAMPIDIWSGCNIFDDDFPRRVRSLPETLAVVGIHLCKMLGPRCVSVFNSIGRTKAPFMCLAPCCLPRMTRKNDRLGEISVQLYETDRERVEREAATKLRDQAMGRRTGRSCYLCGDEDHWARNCPLLPKDDEEARLKVLREAAAMAPCWRCGVVGHRIVACPSAQKSCRPTLRLPPTTTIDVSTVLSAQEPFGMYCELLAGAVQARNGTKEVRETTLVGESHERAEGQSWNSTRKAKYIVVCP